MVISFKGTMGIDVSMSLEGMVILKMNLNDFGRTNIFVWSNKGVESEFILEFGKRNVPHREV